MPDNSIRIAAIDAAIASGATSVSIDGQTVTYRNYEEMRKIRQDLIQSDTSGLYCRQRRRKRTIYTARNPW